MADHMESGKVKSLKELAERENIDTVTSVSLIVNLISLTPNIVTAIFGTRVTSALVIELYDF